MQHLIDKKDIVWGYLSQFLNIGSNLLVLPFILMYLSPEDIGIWYVFIAMVGLIQLLEFGFLPTISRYISYIYSGAKRISENEIAPSDGETIDFKLLHNIIESSRKIYLIIAIISTIVIIFGGTWYLSTLSYKGDIYNVYFSWNIYGISTIILFYFGYYNSILKGRGDQTTLNKIVVISKLTNILFVIPLLCMGFGLISIAIGGVSSTLVDRLLVRRAVFSKHASELSLAAQVVDDEDYTKIIWNKAKLMGVVQIGNFLTTRCSLFIVSSCISLDAAAAYGFTLQVTSVVVIIASMYFGLQMPRFSAEYVNGSIESIRELVSKGLGISWIIFLLCSIFIVSTGPFLLSVLTPNVELLPTAMLCVFLVSALLEMNHSLCTAFLTTRNNLIFTSSIFMTGVLIVITSYVLGGYYGLWGIVISQFACQILYNNWKWPLVVSRCLNINFINVLTGATWYSK